MFQTYLLTPLTLGLQLAFIFKLTYGLQLAQVPPFCRPVGPTNQPTNEFHLAEIRDSQHTSQDNARHRRVRHPKEGQLQLASCRPPLPAQRTTKAAHARPMLIGFSTVWRGSVSVPHWGSAHWTLKWKLRM